MSESRRSKGEPFLAEGRRRRKTETGEVMANYDSGATYDSGVLYDAGLPPAYFFFQPARTLFVLKVRSRWLS